MIAPWQGTVAVWWWVSRVRATRTCSTWSPWATPTTGCTWKRGRNSIQKSTNSSLPESNTMQAATWSIKKSECTLFALARKYSVKLTLDFLSIRFQSGTSYANLGQVIDTIDFSGHLFPHSTVLFIIFVSEWVTNQYKLCRSDQKRRITVENLLYSHSDRENKGNCVRKSASFEHIFIQNWFCPGR